MSNHMQQNGGLTQPEKSPQSDPRDGKNHNMALPIGNERDDSGFVTPSAAVKLETSDLLLQTIHRLLPSPTMPRLTEKILMRSHLEEVNMLLIESSLMGTNGFLPGCEQRCRIAIRDSFSNFADVQRQVSLWFSHGASWAQIQRDLVATFASARDVTQAYTKSIALLQFGPFFCTECRDLYVIYHEVFEQYPHRLIDFVSAVVGKLPQVVRDKIVAKLATEAGDEYWQLARPFWVAGEYRTVVQLLEDSIRVDAAIKDVHKAQYKGNSRHGYASDNVQQTEQKNGWLMEWVSQQPSVWVAYPKSQQLPQALRSKATEVKGPMRKNTKPYFLLSFKEDGVAKSALREFLTEEEYRPFSKNA